MYILHKPAKAKRHVHMGDVKHSKGASAYTNKSKPKLMALTRANDLLWSICHFCLQIQLLNNFRGFPDSSVGKESTCNAGDPHLIPGSGRSTGEGIGYPFQYSCGSAGKESACNVGDLGSIPGLGRSPREGKRYPLQYSGLENFMDCIVHGVTKSRTWLSNFHFHFSINNFRAVNFLIGPLINKLQCGDDLGAY